MRDNVFVKAEAKWAQATFLDEACQWRRA